MTSASCDHNDDLLALGAMRLLSPAEEAQLVARLQRCPVCQQRMEEYRALARAMPRLLTTNTVASASPTHAPTDGIASTRTPALPQQRAGKKAEDDKGANPEIPGQPHPSPLRPGSRLSRQPRLMNALSGLAAVLLLAVLLAGFRWLVLGREQGQAIHLSGCISKTHTDTTSTWQCGLLVIDYTKKPETLLPLDANTGNPLPDLKPLPVGNVILSAITPDRRTLVLAIEPHENTSAVYLQIVLLDQWKLGPQIKTGHYVDALAISDDGAHIYAVMPQYSAGTTTIWLQSYVYHPNQSGGPAGGLQEGWKSTLPFLPNSDGFTLSPDGATLYAFTETTSPAQVMQAHLGDTGLEQIQSLQLNQLASGADPATNTAPYKKGDPVPSAYHPAVIFSPDRTMLYLVYAPASDPTHDRLLTVYLLKWSGISDLPITDATQTLADFGPGNAAAFSPLARGAHTAPAAHLAATTAPFNERKERGVISPDGQWLYVTGESQTATIFSDGTSQEANDYIGLRKINVQNGKVVRQWFPKDSFDEVHITTDGKTLYLFKQPPNSPTIIATSTTLLSFSTQTEQYTPLLNLQLQERIIVAP